MIAASADEAAIEAVRVAALGKKGSVSELLKGLGKMTAEDYYYQLQWLYGHKASDLAA